MKLKTLTLGLTAAGLTLSTVAQATTVEYWTTQTQSDRLQTLEVMADVFEALNPGVDIKVVAIDENDMPTQIAAAAASRTLPDVVEVDSNLSLAFAEQGIVDLKATTAVVEAVGKDRFYQGALTLVEEPNKGEYVSLPYSGWVQGIWYRADWFEDAGLEPPTNWNNIRKAAAYFNKPEDNQYGILIGTKADSYAEQVYTQLALSNDAGQFDKSGNLIFNSEKQKEVLDFYKELSQYTPPGPQTWRARDYYLQGKLAMFFYSTYIMDDIALAEVAASSLGTENFSDLKGAAFDQNLVKNTRLSPTITNSSASTFGTLVGFSIMKNDNQAELDVTKAFVEYMNERDQVVAYSHMAPGGHLPMLRDIAETEEFLNDPKGIFAGYGKESIKEIISGFENIRNFSIVNGKAFPKSGEIFSKQIIPRMIYSSVIENKDTQKSLDWAEGEMKQLIAK
ncbi:extracellular solute-binding protein [Vibrio sp. ZSDZ34]|jgi:multiple sugar transport system substrate-binding protein|uniref:Extracellular solute-binding protein n=1 Tax=Vibrio gelatinilyticus TaxID=2893468 RepID=A0A9X1WC51_9VIBR|nr:extracellular solute-binding protein [Vibrio gelatinilyticus]MCJ2377581.1 extracellular solute-binding protein [Vibrio gelatinilyticus]